MSEGVQGIEKIKQLAREVSQREGCILYDVDLSGSGATRVLRVYIDKDAGGASIDDCASVSQGLSLLLDVEDAIDGGAYELEVSTPGLDRVLCELWHYEKVLGKNIQVSTSEPVEAPRSNVKPTKNVEGILKSASENEIVIEMREMDWLVPFEDIHKAKMKYVFEHPGAKKAKGAKNKKGR